MHVLDDHDFLELSSIHKFYRYFSWSHNFFIHQKCPKSTHYWGPGSVTDWNLVRLLEILESGILPQQKTLHNFGYLRILCLKIFQLPRNFIWNIKLPGISNKVKDTKDSESCTLLYFVMHLLIINFVVQVPILILP